MIIAPQSFAVRNLQYTIRPAIEKDAKALSALRLKIDGETENLDREKGEAFIDEAAFQQIIKIDTEKSNHLFLVAEVENQVVGFSRCEGNDLKRFAHKVEFGVCVLQKYWGYKIGTNLLQRSTEWADGNAVKKMTLHVLETNAKAIELYQNFGFEIEGILKQDKKLSDGQYYHTVVMGRIKGSI